MHGSLTMNMDVEQHAASNDDPKSCLPGIFREFVELIEGERALREIKYFFNNHPQSLATVYTWKEEDPEEGHRKYESSCLHLAAEDGRLDVVEQLVEMGVPVDIKTEIAGQTPLMFCC